MFQLRQRNGEEVWLCQSCRLDEEARERRRRYEERVAKTVQHFAEPRPGDSHVRTACGIEFGKGQMNGRPALAWPAQNTNCKSCKRTDQHKNASEDGATCGTNSQVSWIATVIPSEAIVSGRYDKEVTG